MPKPPKSRPTPKPGAKRPPAPASDPPEIVKQIRQLRSRTARDQHRSYYIEGARIVAQAIQAGAKIERGVIAPALVAQTEHAAATVAALKATGAPLTELSPSEFAGISFKENLQGIGAVVRLKEEPLGGLRLDDNRPWVALNGVGNPGNLGAIMRTCDAVGCAGLILIGDTTDPYHPAAIRASMGSLFALRMVRASFADFVRWKRERGYQVVGTTPDVELEYQRVAYPAPCILLMGSERLGLSPAEQEPCDLLVRIPMAGTCDSLNLGVATSIMLYEIFQQGRGRPADQ